MKLYGIYEQVVGVPASSLSQLRGPRPENVEDPCPTVFILQQASHKGLANHGG